MKKLVLVALAGLTIFAACKNDDDDVTGIEISKGGNVVTGDTLNVWGESLFTAKCTPGNSESVDFMWTSSNPDVASIEPFGPDKTNYCKVTAKEEGETVITVSTSNGYSTSCTVIVNEIKVTGIKIENDSVYMADDTKSLKVTVTPANSSFAGYLTYQSSDESVAKIDAKGKIQTVSVGECEVTVTSRDGKVSGKANIKVMEVIVTGIIGNLAEKEVSVESGNFYTLDLTITPDNATYKNINWVSSDEKVATIENGVIYGMGDGECTITATASNLAISNQWKVYGSLLHLTSGSSYKNGKDYTFYVEDPKTQTKWVSSDTTIAKIDEKGNVSCGFAGECTITNEKRQWKFAVDPMIIEKDTVQIDYFAKNVTISKKATAEQKKLTWAVSDESVATIDTLGMVKTVGLGNCRITATNKDKTVDARWEISVIEKKNAKQ